MTDRNHDARDAPTDRIPHMLPQSMTARRVYTTGRGKVGTSDTQSASLWMALALIAGGVVLTFLFIFIL